MSTHELNVQCPTCGGRWSTNVRWERGVPKRLVLEARARAHAALEKLLAQHLTTCAKVRR